jgi:hypothetical protein
VRRGQINFPERAKTQFSDQNIQLVPSRASRTWQRLLLFVPISYTYAFGIIKAYRYKIP